MTNEEIKNIIRLAEELKKACKHEKTVRTPYDSVKCTICGDEFGWWCPESPNHICEYFGVHRGWYPYQNSDKEWFNDNDCIYCHQPEERN